MPPSAAMLNLAKRVIGDALTAFDGDMPEGARGHLTERWAPDIAQLQAHMVGPAINGLLASPETKEIVDAWKKHRGSAIEVAEHKPTAESVAVAEPVLSKGHVNFQVHPLRANAVEAVKAEAVPNESLTAYVSHARLIKAKYPHVGL